MRTLKFEVTVPGIPETDQYSDEYVTAWLRQEIGHPYDAAYEADVTVKLLSSDDEDIDDANVREHTEETRRRTAELIQQQMANPERENNGCMVYRGPASQGA